jgi:hypothetical protein
MRSTPKSREGVSALRYRVGMDNTEIWAVVSRMLAVLTVGHSAMLLLSKLMGLPEAKTPKLLSKLVECAALFALVMTSTMIVSGFVGYGGSTPPSQIPELRSNAPITEALTAYFVYAGISLAATALF